MTFDYAHQTDWPMTSGQHQSPIDIQTQHVQSSQLSAISWRGLYQAKTITGEATTLKASGIGAAYLNDRDFAFYVYVVIVIGNSVPGNYLIVERNAPVFVN